MKKICVLASGGVESSALLYLLSKKFRVHPLYISHGFIWEKAELHWLKRYIRKIGRPNLRAPSVAALPMKEIYGNHWSLTGSKVPGSRSRDEAVYLPGRNLLLLSAAAVFCRRNNIPLIAIGILKTNPFPDSSPAFLRKMESVTGAGLKFRLKILTPFARYHKSDVVRAAKNAPLEWSFSCLNPRGMKHCMRCNKCEERRKALKKYFRLGDR